MIHWSSENEPPPPTRTAGRCARPIALIVGLSTLIGCVTRQPVIEQGTLDAIRQRTTNVFARAYYLKPTEAGDLPALVHQLAPLLVLEAPAASDRLTPALQPPVVFFRTNQVALHGRPHAQVSFVWPAFDADGSPPKLPAQGVRITLNSEGVPVIWEALADTSKARILFIAQSLEVQARQELGRPLPERQFAVEQPATESAGQVVARVIEDGPVVMGPIVYLQSGTHDVTTVACRCMDSQARELAGQAEYRLRPWPEQAPRALRQLLRRTDESWPNNHPVGLRLPVGF